MRKYSVPVMTIFSLFVFILLLAGFGWTLQNQLGEETGKETKTIKPEQPAAKEKQGGKEKHILALGDSLTRGTGDESGKGYTGYLIDQLKKKSKEDIVLHNLGVKGYRSGQLLQQIDQPEVQRQAAAADMILITIGGNDLFQQGQTLKDPSMENVAGLQGKYLANLETVISKLRDVNKDAPIYFIGLYNPFIDMKDAPGTTKAVRDWNYATGNLLDSVPNTVFVPTFDIFQLNVNKYLFSDKFHPNNKGYKLIAERVASLITW
ncbi:SGNH/GDSL hydrolase family protein [Mesobacillus zeae]|uniref:GDSL family lipase n=1 Tax=Mesobacillus zeae TaxID=1917180 RepID=A0A398BDG3_9BACI|nr:SGNH/GDSL hydrolase family protein [Mesobacillus zeae]RID85696.1 GDSL family lipase [Mesobacillus zeae]